MDQTSLVSEICDQADSFLTGVNKLAEARAAISEWMTINHPMLSPDLKMAAITEALSVLVEEGFFEADAGAEK